MTRTALTWLCGFSVFGVLGLGCFAGEPCVVQGVAVQCNCGSSLGARVCQDDGFWSECNCSGAIALPNAVSGDTPAATGGAGGAGAGGAGGTSGRGGSGGSTPDPLDSGMTTPDASLGDAALADAGGPDGAVVSEPPYRACTSDNECDPNGICLQTAGIPAPSTVCAPACVNPSDCPVPDGTYEARVACVVGYCVLDCTPVLFAPLLSCPTGMVCIAAQLANAFCHDDGV